MIAMMAFLCMASNSCDFIGEFFGFYDYTPPEAPKLYFENKTEESVHFFSWIVDPGEDFGPCDFYNQLPPMIKVEDNGFTTVEEKSCYGSLQHGRLLHVLVFKQSTLDRYSEEEIIRDNIYDTRYVLTEDDLVDNTLTIIHTGD